MRCPKCYALTRVDVQSLIDCEGVKYRRACVACSWDVWEVQPGKLADVSWASIAVALEAALADPDPSEPSEHQPGNGPRQRRVWRHAGPEDGALPRPRAQAARPDPTAGSLVSSTG
jgi:hypothetical protein